MDQEKANPGKPRQPTAEFDGIRLRTRHDKASVTSKIADVGAQ